MTIHNDDSDALQRVGSFRFSDSICFDREHTMSRTTRRAGHHIWGRLVFIMAFIAIAVVNGGTSAFALESGDTGFGWQWVRQHPFVIEAATVNPNTWDFAKYVGTGITVLQWDPTNPWAASSRPPAYTDMPWHGYANRGAPAMPGQTGWLVGDEPNRLAMPGYASTVQSLRQQPAERQKVIYTTALGMGATTAQLYGDGSNPGYTYSQYLDDFLNIVKPDILFFDNYPFSGGGSTSSSYLNNLMVVRAKAQGRQMPYWGWAQAFNSISESDNRFNVYSQLTMGYTGISYWTYDYTAGTGNGMIDASGNPTPLYSIVKQTNAQVVNLGRSLRFLNSTDVRFLPGRHSVLFGTAANSTPDGLTNWAASAGGDPHILGASVASGQLGSAKSGLIGFFTDAANDHYFMLTNLNHARDLSASAGSLSFVLTFDEHVNSVWLLNSITGVAQEISLSNHVLNWSLPGGTGDLFKYDNGNFAGLVPEPSVGAIGGLISVGLILRRSRQHSK